MSDKVLKAATQILSSFKSPSVEARNSQLLLLSAEYICVYESLKTLQVLLLHFKVERKRVNCFKIYQNHV